MYEHKLSNEQRERFLKLCQAAHAAILENNPADAHLYFRYAAQIHPYSTTVWIGLAKVSSTFADKRQALENVLAINPDHHEAQELLNQL